MLICFVLSIITCSCFVATTHQQHVPCLIGQGPGVWRADNQPGMRFESSDPSCALVDYVDNTTAVGQMMAPRILWLSDSVDHDQVQTFCETHLRGKVVMHEKSFDNLEQRKAAMAREKADSPAHMWSFTCNLSGGPYNRTKLMYNWMVSPGKTGPFWCNIPASGWQKVLDAKLAWQEYSNLLPDMIVTSTTLWEMGRMALRYPNVNTTFRYPPGVVDTFIREYTQFIGFVKTVFPGVPILHHAHHTPYFMTPPYTVWVLGTMPLFYELNEAGIYAATALGLDVWAWDATFHQVLNRTSLYKAGKIHMQPWLAPDILNIYMNYAAHYRSLHHSRG